MFTNKSTEEKRTNLIYTTQSGLEIKITVFRRYGSHRYLIDGGYGGINEGFSDTCELSFEVPTSRGQAYGTVDSSRLEYDEKEGYYICRIPAHLKNPWRDIWVPVAFDKQWIEENLIPLITEKLTDEENPEIAIREQERKEEVERVKKLIRDGKVLPKATLIAKRKAYKEGMLEGGYGFNPYDYYISQEYADSILDSNEHD